jgi:DNA-binding transcriptional regulator YiaG
MTDMHKSDGRILKTDAKCRVRTPADRRESLLDEFERSGLSAAKFAELAGIKDQTFAAWSLRRRKLPTA